MNNPCQIWGIFQPFKFYGLALNWRQMAETARGSEMRILIWPGLRGASFRPKLLLPHQFNVLQLICFLLRDAPAFATKLAQKLQGGVGWAGGRGSGAGVGGMADCMSCGDPCSPTVDKQRVQHLQLTVYYAVNNVNKKKSKQVRRNYKLLPWKLKSPFARQEF